MKDFSHKNYPSNREIEDFSGESQFFFAERMKEGRDFWRTTAIVFGILAVGELILRLV